MGTSMSTTNPFTARLASSIVVLGLASGCDPVETRRGSFTEANNNERFTVSGLADGGPGVRVTVPTDVEFANAGPSGTSGPDLVFGDAKVVGSPSSSFAQMFLEVANNGETPLCFIHGETIEYLDENGAVLATDSTFVDGSVARTPAAGLLTGTCIIEGGSGVLTSLVEDLDVEAVSSVRILVEADDAWQYAAPDAEVVASSVEVLSERELRISLENVGSEPATMETSKVILFDADGEFLSWEFALGLDATPGTIAPGGTGVMDVSLVGVPGNPAEVIVNLGWEQ